MLNDVQMSSWERKPSLVRGSVFALSLIIKLSICREMQCNQYFCHGGMCGTDVYRHNDSAIVSMGGTLNLLFLYFDFDCRICLCSQAFPNS